MKKDFKDAWYHLKVAVINGHQITPQSKLKSLYFQLYFGNIYKFDNKNVETLSKICNTLYLKRENIQRVIVINVII